jgi:hypothetical protein
VVFPEPTTENPLVWMIPVDRIIVDMRTMTPELQEHAYALVVIPFVPAARGNRDGAN